jgi:hypothetical protein
MASYNIDMLQIVAHGLRELKEDVVFVGGAVAELYANDPAASDIRPTLDVDCVIEISSRIKYSKLEDDLRTKGFIHDTSKGASICRRIYQGIKVDVMPLDESILGFSNKWYSEGIKNKIAKALPNGIVICVFPPEYFLAAKFEAHMDRGGKDLRQSHDFEDIVYLLDNCHELLNNISHANLELKAYLKRVCQDLITNNFLTEGIESALPFGSGYERTEIIINLLKQFAAMN